jgi:hypothetical protein
MIVKKEGGSYVKIKGYPKERQEKTFQNTQREETGKNRKK